MTKTTFSEKVRSRLLFSLTISIFMLAGVYGYFLQDTVRAGMQQTATKAEISDLKKEISDAEIAYGNEVGDVSFEDAVTDGFVETEESIFVSRKAPTTLVSYNTNE